MDFATSAQVWGSREKTTTERSSETSRLGLLTKFGIRGVIEEAPLSRVVIAGRSAGRTRASSSSVSGSGSRLPLLRRGIRGAPAATPVSPAMIRGTIRASSSWTSRVSSSGLSERSRPRKKLARAAAPPINAGMRRASSCWAVEGDNGQTLIRCVRERSGKPTFWLRSGGKGDRNGQGVDAESPKDEGGESDFGEHSDWECREKEEIITAPGLTFER